MGYGIILDPVVAYDTVARPVLGGCAGRTRIGLVTDDIYADIIVVVHIIPRYNKAVDIPVDRQAFARAQNVVIDFIVSNPDIL